MHGIRPVAQGVHHHLQYSGVRGVDGITGPGVLNVIAVLIRQRAVIGEVINALERQRWAQFIALCGVVINHIQNHLDARVMIGTNHLTKTLHSPWAIIVWRQGEEAQGVIAPEVFQPFIKQMLIVREPVHRHQLDGGNAQAFDVVDRGLMPHPFKRATQRLRNGRVKLGKAFHVGFVQHRMGPGHRRTVVILPVEGVGVDHPTFWCERRAIAGIEAQIQIVMPHLIGEV